MNPTQVTQFLHSLRQAYRDLEVDIEKKRQTSTDGVLDTSDSYNCCY